MKVGVASRSAQETVHLLCPVHNGVSYLSALFESLQAQDHTHWVLWLVDDASADGSLRELEAWSRRDPRVRVHPSPPERLGAVGAFAWLWARVPADARVIAFADQDDVWLPDKLSRSMAAMRAAEGDGSTPVLVHTDLQVVDRQLEPIASSFWRYAGIVPEPPTFRRVVAQNVATGCTMLLNRALYDRVGPIPAGATMHDAWVACAAALLGRVVALSDRTVLYRQHGANTLGAQPSVSAVSWRSWPARLRQALTGHNRVKHQLIGTAAQAALLLEQFDAQLTAHDRDFLRAYAHLPQLPWWRRKLGVAALHCHPEHGWLRNTGVIWRA